MLFKAYVCYFQGHVKGKLLQENGWVPKIVSAQTGTSKTFSKSQNNWKRLNMFRAIEVDRKIREINLRNELF